MISSIFNLINVYSLVACAVALFWYYSQSTFNFWRNLNVKYLKPTPFFGNTGAYVLLQKPIHQTFDVLYKELFDEPFGGIYQSRDPLLMVKDPKLVSAILIKDFKNFHDRRLSFFFNPNKKINPLNVNLLTIDGERWRALRQKMSPLFAAGKVKQMSDQIFHCVNQLIEFIDKRLDGCGDFAAKRLFDRLTIDIIGSCAFGIECNSLKSNDKFAAMCEEPFKPRLANAVRLVVSVFSTRLLTWLNLRDLTKEASDFFFNLSLDTVMYRRENGASRNDMLQLLMALQNTHTDPKFAVRNDGVKILENEEFDEIDIAANSYLFFIAGFETTSAALSLCLYELALNQDIQKRLRSDVQHILHEHKSINYESLKEMSYLNAVIDETLRKYPTVPFLFRQCTEDYVIPNTKVQIPAGTKIVVPVWSIQHDWRYYPNPEVFDPERFLGSNKLSIPSGAYLPFGDGPRYCIGKYFGEIELKAALSAMVLNYNFSPCAKTEIPLKFKEGTPFLNAKPEIWINISKRNV